MKTTKLHKSARWYARHGWYVVPLHEPLFTDGACSGCSCEQWRRDNGQPDYICPSPGKHPRMNAWEEKASNDIIQIDKWWHFWPNANVGIAAGKSGLVVLDGDKYKDGANDWAAGETITNLTGGGGEHWVFKHPQIDEKLGNSKGNLPRWIDVRGWGGMFVVPPSLHPSGNHYEWEAEYGPHEIAPAALPDELVKMLVDAATAVSSTEFSENCDVPNYDTYAKKMSGLLLALLTKDRSRQDFWIVRGLIRAGMSDDQIRAIYTQSDPTGKYTEKNGKGDKYLAATIEKARGHINKFKPLPVMEIYDE